MTALFQRLTIYQRMLLNIAVIAAGMFIMLWLLFYQSAQLGDLTQKAQLAEKLNSGMLMLRRNEKDFLARVDMKYVDKFNNNATKLQQLIASYQALDEDNEVLSTFAKLTNDYKNKFMELAQLQQKIGLNPKDGLYGELREAVHQIEDSIKSHNEYRLLANTLQLRRREKDFMLRLDLKYVAKFGEDIVTLRASLEQSNISATDKVAITTNIDNYQQKFVNLTEVRAQMGLKSDQGLLGELRATIQQTEALLVTMIAENELSIADAADLIKLVGLVVSALIALLVCLFSFVSSNSIIRCIRNISGKIGEIRTSNNLILRADASGHDELAVMANHFNSLMNDFQQLVTEVNEALATLDGAAHDLANNVDETRQDMQHQISETDMVATAVNEMGATIEEIAKNTEQAAEKSNGTNLNAQHGYKEVMQTVDSIHQLSEQLSGAGTVVQQLEHDVGNIGSVLDVIRGIADQTNLLALNAAIEAARAGEQGRGFAVVADEVRNLAMRTQESTQEIEQIIKTLQSRTTQVVEMMDSCRNRGDQSATQAEKTGTLLMQITEDVTIISDMSTQIAAAIEEQSMVAAEVNKNVVKIKDIADHSSEKNEEIHTTSHAVSAQAAALVGAVDKFAV
ncbi:MAG: methyl-accepting chemotaxis protein [Phenylobacterium sp.]|jgi:methyl-accepting chemotaxis protein